MRERKVRQPVFSGQFYPSDSSELRGAVSRYIDSAEVVPAAKSVKAIIAPHAGYIYSGSTAGFAYQAVRDTFGDSSSKVKVVILGPSHQAVFSGVAESPANVWETPLGEVNVHHMSDDTGLVFQSDDAHNMEHSIEVQLPFLQVSLENVDFEITPLLLSDVDHREVAEVLSSEFLNKGDKGVSNTLFIASTDLSHYKPISQAEKIDKKTMDCIKNLDTESIKDHGDACGKLPIMVIMEVANHEGWKPKLLDYSTSADASDDESAVVGYVAFSFD